MKSFLIIYYGGSSEMIQAYTMIEALHYIIGDLDQVYKAIEIKN